MVINLRKIGKRTKGHLRHPPPQLSLVGAGIYSVKRMKNQRSRDKYGK